MKVPTELFFLQSFHNAIFKVYSICVDNCNIVTPLHTLKQHPTKATGLLVEENKLGGMNIGLY